MTFDEHRGLLVGIAYRILGSYADAEDVAQDAWVRWRTVDSADVRDPRGYLVRIATRLAIDRLRQLKARREAYVGPWLPEPIATGDTEDAAELADSVSMAMLVVLESLSPAERAVFVLHESFGYRYGEIAEIVGSTETAVRQMSRRARDHVQARRPRFDSDRAVQRQLTESFLRACQEGDLDGLLALLAPDATMISDGGGRAVAPPRPITGGDKIAKLIIAWQNKPIPDPAIAVAEINGEPAIVVTSAGTPVTVLAFEIVDGRAQTIYLVANPDKLRLNR